MRDPRALRSSRIHGALVGCAIGFDSRIRPHSDLGSACSQKLRRDAVVRDPATEHTVKAGFCLVEMTIALAIVLVVMGAMFAVMNPASGAFHSQPEAIDMHQRLRVAVDAISSDLTMAGAGTGKYFASVLPYRRGPLAPDSPATYPQRPHFDPLRTSRCGRDDAERANGCRKYRVRRCHAWICSERVGGDLRRAGRVQYVPPGCDSKGSTCIGSHQWSALKNVSRGGECRADCVGDVLDQGGCEDGHVRADAARRKPNRPADCR